MKKNMIFGLFALLMVTSCNNEDEDSIDDKEDKVENIDDSEGIEDIEIIFNGSKFESDVEKELLEELKICSYDSEVVKTSEVPLCSPESFKFLPLNKDVTLKNGFMVLIKAETGGFSIRRLLVFQRERGQLVKTNGFAANIIGRIPTETGYDDLILRFYDRDEIGSLLFYNCIFTWKDGKYEFDYVAKIYGTNWGGKVELADREEYSKSVYESIMKNKCIF